MDQLDDLNLDQQPTSGFKPPSMFQIMFDKMVSDMRFVGMFSIIYGALNCISIFGALIGVPLIIIGLKVREAADQFAIFKTTNDANALRMGFDIQGKYFRILKILIIIGLVLTVLVIVLVIVIITSGIASLMQMQNGSY